MKVTQIVATLKNPYKFILRIFLDFLMLSAIGNALSIFMIPGDWWSLHVVFTNCLFSIGIIDKVGCANALANTIVAVPLGGVEASGRPV